MIYKPTPMLIIGIASNKPVIKNVLVNNKLSNSGCLEIDSNNLPPKIPKPIPVPTDDNPIIIDDAIINKLSIILII